MKQATTIPIAGGFTLVELLVVISIIVVLLALLTPAIDQAIYRAEMAICGANLKAAGTGATVYCSDFRRRYPWRPTIEKYSNGAFGWLNNANEPGSDDRVVFRDYITINKALNCPLDPPNIDIEYSRPATYTFSDYALWFGFFYTGRQGVRKLGDRLEALDEISGTVRSYDLLVSDYSVVHRTQGYGHSTHPDDRGMWRSEHRQDQPAPWSVVVGGQAVLYGEATLSYFTGGADRGSMELNFGRQDGSIQTLKNIGFAPADADPMDYIPVFRDPSTDSGRNYQVPRS
jgi:prepilin-type N-terminal cleavage/methylation domain-containing protein